MPKRSRRELSYRILFAVAMLYSALMIFAAFNTFIADNKTHFVFHPQQLLSELLMLLFLPLTLAGRRKPRTASLAFFCIAAASILLLLTMTGNTGDGEGEAMIATVIFIGIPALLAGLLFRWRNGWNASPNTSPKIFPL